MPPLFYISLMVELICIYMPGQKVTEGMCELSLEQYTDQL